MFIELLVAVVLGILAGIITGLVPGIHINLVSAMLLSSSTFLLGYTNGLILSTFIVSMSVTHSFVDVIPSIYLGAPDPSTVLSVLPGHQLLLEGKGHYAVYLTAIGSLIAIGTSTVIAPLMFFTIESFYSFIQPYIGYGLLVVSVFLILRQTTWSQRGWALVIFSLSAVLGILVLSFKTLNNPLFPLLTGLFGTSMLISSLYDKVIIPKQSIVLDQLNKKDTLYASVAGSFAGLIASILPGLGSAQATILADLVFKIKEKGYLIMVGSVNTVSFILSLITLYVLDKARNGSVIVIQELIDISLKELVHFFMITLVVGVIAFYVTLFISKQFVVLFEYVNYQILLQSIIVLLVGLTIVLSGWIGLIVLFIATTIGLLPLYTNVNRSITMACLIVPVILYLI